MGRRPRLSRVRVVGLDLGRRRIGVAVSDSDQRVAVPHAVIARSGDAAADRRALVEVVSEIGAGRVVVGLPVSLDGRAGPAAREAQAEAEALADELGVPVELHDERLTTVVADRALQAAGMGGKGRRQAVDSAAATVILQSWLDAAPARSASLRPGEGGRQPGGPPPAAGAAGGETFT